MPVYLGVRYGEPPKRFHSPVMAGGWQGVWEANEFPNRAMQEDKAGMLGQRIYGALSEDCLFMNIYTPGQRSSGLVPVMVWIHGGGFRGGSGNEYDGSVLAPQGNVVVITLNFRVGAFGHLDLSDQGPEFEGSASNGFKDMILTLNWIRQNIEDYGGDPGNVTILVSRRVALLFLVCWAHLLQTVSSIKRLRTVQLPLTDHRKTSRLRLQIV